MLGHKALWDSWKTQWGPKPVSALNESRTDRRFVPITLPGSGEAARRAGLAQ